MGKRAVNNQSIITPFDRFTSASLSRKARGNFERARRASRSTCDSAVRKRKRGGKGGGGNCRGGGLPHRGGLLTERIGESAGGKLNRYDRARRDGAPRNDEENDSFRSNVDRTDL